MNIETVNKIKSNINPKFAELFSKDDLESIKFIPINKQAGFFFVVIKEGSNKSEISDFITQKDSDAVKFISFDEESFNDLLVFYCSTYYNKVESRQSPTVSNSQASEKIPEANIDKNGVKKKTYR